MIALYDLELDTVLFFNKYQFTSLQRGDPKSYAAFFLRTSEVMGTGQTSLCNESWKSIKNYILAYKASVIRSTRMCYSKLFSGKAFDFEVFLIKILSYL